MVYLKTLTDNKLHKIHATKSIEIAKKMVNRFYKIDINNIVVIDSEEWEG